MTVCMCACVFSVRMRVCLWTLFSYKFLAFYACSQKAVSAKSIETVNAACLNSGWRRLYLGISHSSLLVRSLCMGVQMSFGVAVLLWPIVRLVLQDDAVPVPGAWYCVLKGVLAAAVSWLSFPGVLAGALSEANFSDLLKAH